MPDDGTMNDTTATPASGVDMGAVTGSPVSAAVGAAGAPVVAGGPAAQSAPSPSPPVITVNDGNGGGETQAVGGAIPMAWPTPVVTHQVPIMVHDGAAFAAAIRELHEARASIAEAKQTYDVRTQLVLDQLTSLDDLELWIRASELRQHSLGLNDEAMAKAAVARMPREIILGLDSTAGKEVVRSWEALKTALRTMTSGAHPLIAAGTEFLREAGRTREENLSPEAAFEGGRVGLRPSFGRFRRSIRWNSPML